MIFLRFFFFLGGTIGFVTFVCGWNHDGFKQSV